MVATADSWYFYYLVVEDALATCAANIDEMSNVPDKTRPWLHMVKVNLASPNAEGLASEEESDSLRNIRDALTQELSQSMDAVICGVFTTNGYSDHFFYGNLSGPLEPYVGKVMARFDGYKWVCNTTSDPDWKHYIDVIRPDLYDRQRMRDMNLITRLREQGDVLSTPRSITHRAYFQNDDGRQKFIDFIKAVGFRLLEENESDETEFDKPWILPQRANHPCAVTFVREDMIEVHAIVFLTKNILDVALGFEGYYAGWDSPVQRMRPANTSDQEDRILSVDPAVEVNRFFDDSSRSMREPPRFVLLTGGSGSGKTTVRQQRYTPGFVVVDAGEIFFSLCQGKKLQFPDWLEEPMEMIGRWIARKAMEERRHLVTEIVGAKLETVDTLMDAMQRIGYASELAFVDCDPKSACMRNLARKDDWISATYSEPYHLRWLIESANEISSEQQNRIAKPSWLSRVWTQLFGKTAGKD